MTLPSQADRSGERTPFGAVKQQLDRGWRWCRRSSAWQALHKLVHLLLNLNQHFVLSQTMTAAGLSVKAEFCKGTRYRYLRSYYLGGGLDVADRLRVAINHYRAIAHHFRPEFLALSASRGYVLWQRTTEELALRITLRFPYFYNFDGDLCLVLEANGKDLFIMTFSMAAGAVAAAPEPQILLVSGIQGVAGKIEDIRAVTECCANVAPAQLLLLCAEALAAAIGVDAIVGMGKRRLADGAAGAEQGKAFDYDAFWMPIAGVDEARHFYPMPLPFVDKPLESIPAKHRSRARKRRELRNSLRKEIALQVHGRLASDCLKRRASLACLPA